MASLDVNRPAAQEQLRILGEQIEVATLPLSPASSRSTSRAARGRPRSFGFDVLMLDTAGRLHVDAALMAEMQSVAECRRRRKSFSSSTR